jgi:hypothetical protein
MTFVGLAPDGIRPVKVASVIEVPCVRTKSSADSISNFGVAPPLSGRVAVAIFPSGAPVLKKVVSAIAGAAGSKPISAAETASFACVLDIAFSPQRGLLAADRWFLSWDVQL